MRVVLVLAAVLAMSAPAARAAVADDGRVLAGYEAYMLGLCLDLPRGWWCPGAAGLLAEVSSPTCARVIRHERLVIDEDPLVLEERRLGFKLEFSFVAGPDGRFAYCEPAEP